MPVNRSYAIDITSAPTHFYHDHPAAPRFTHPWRRGAGMRRHLDESQRAMPIAWWLTAWFAG
jgi:hypothetical protein